MLNDKLSQADKEALRALVAQAYTILSKYDDISEPYDDVNRIIGKLEFIEESL